MQHLAQIWDFFIQMEIESVTVSVLYTAKKWRCFVNFCLHDIISRASLVCPSILNTVAAM